MTDRLVEAIKARQAILFVGAGVSRNLGLPSWGELMDEMAHQLGFDPEVFKGLGGYLELAEYYEQQKASLGPLRSWMDRNWHADVGLVDKSAVHQAIVDLDFPTIYTTNYDRWIEIALERRKKKFIKVTNVGDFTGIRDDLTQVVKLHGDFDDDKSLVLTESSYFERLSFESPLDMKLRADSIGRSLLFIGYSLTDINIRYLLYKLQQLWAESAYVRARPSSYIFLSSPNPVQEAVLQGRGIIPIVSAIDDPGAGLLDFLERLRSEALGGVT